MTPPKRWYEHMSMKALMAAGSLDISGCPAATTDCDGDCDREEIACPQ